MAKNQDVQDRANARFKKAEERSREGDKVTAENAAKARAVDANTTRLKGLRLEKERLDREAAAAEPAPKPARKSRSTAK